MRALEFITGHVTYNPAYTYKFQLKTTKVLLRRYFNFGPIANKRCQIAPLSRISCLLLWAGNSNFLLRGVIWHLFLAMGPKSKYLLTLSHL